MFQRALVKIFRFICLDIKISYMNEFKIVHTNIFLKNQCDTGLLTANNLLSVKFEESTMEHKMSIKNIRTLTIDATDYVRSCVSDQFQFFQKRKRLRQFLCTNNGSRLKMNLHTCKI